MVRKKLIKVMFRLERGQKNQSDYKYLEGIMTIKNTNMTQPEIAELLQDFELDEIKDSLSGDDNVRGHAHQA
jgi:hypothetical protein